MYQKIARAAMASTITAVATTTAATSTLTLSMMMKYGYDNVTDETTINETLSMSDINEERLFQAVYLGYLWTALIIGLPGNVLIAIVYIVVKQKRTSDWFIFFLSVYDCAVCVFAVPLYLSIETGAWMKTGSDLACKIEQFTIFTAQFSSVSVLGIIAVDRYLKICHPTKRSLNATQARNLGMCTPLVSAVVAAPILVWDGNVERRFCRIQEEYKRTLGVKFHLCLTFGFFICMFLVVIFCYSHVCFVVSRRMRRHRENALKRKHLMQIPAFLQAISNVDDLHGLSSNQSNRNKKRFSLFSIGNNRRLSAISPWIKARLSLPSDNSGRKLALPPDEMELTTKDSLVDIKRQLDQALMFRAKSSTIEEFPSDKNEVYKNKSDVYDYIRQEMKRKETTRELEASDRTHQDLSNGGNEIENDDKNTEEIYISGSTNCYQFAPKSGPNENQQENLTAAQHSVFQIQTGPLLCLNCSDSHNIKTVTQTDNEKTSSTASVPVSNLDEHYNCHISQFNQTVSHKQIDNFNSSEQSAISDTKNTLPDTSRSSSCIESVEGVHMIPGRSAADKTVKNTSENCTRDCVTTENINTPATCRKVFTRVDNEDVACSSTNECVMALINHHYVPSQTICPICMPTGTTCECLHAQSKCNISDMNFIEKANLNCNNTNEKANSSCNNTNEAKELSERKRFRYSLNSLLLRRKNSLRKDESLREPGLSKKCKSSSSLFSGNYRTQRSESDLTKYNTGSSHSASCIRMRPLTSAHTPEDISHKKNGASYVNDEITDDPGNAPKGCYSKRQSTQSYNKKIAHDTTQAQGKSLYIDCTKSHAHCQTCRGNQLRQLRRTGNEDIDIMKHEPHIHNIELVQATMLPEASQKPPDKYSTRLQENNQLYVETGDQGDDNYSYNTEAKRNLLGHSTARLWCSLQNVLEIGALKLTNSHSRSSSSIARSCAAVREPIIEPCENSVEKNEKMKSKLKHRLNKFHVQNASIPSSVFESDVRNNESNLDMETPLLLSGATKNIQFKQNNKQRRLRFGNSETIKHSNLDFPVAEGTDCDCHHNSQQPDLTPLDDIVLDQDDIEFQFVQSCNKCVRRESTICSVNVVNDELTDKAMTVLSPDSRLVIENLCNVGKRTGLEGKVVNTSNTKSKQREKLISPLDPTTLYSELPAIQRSCTSLPENNSTYAITNTSCSPIDRPLVKNSSSCSMGYQTGVNNPCSKTTWADLTETDLSNQRWRPYINKSTHNAIEPEQAHYDLSNNDDKVESMEISGEVFCYKNMRMPTVVQADGSPVTDTPSSGRNCDSANFNVSRATHSLTERETATTSGRVTGVYSCPLPYEVKHRASSTCKSTSADQLCPVSELCRGPDLVRERLQEWCCCSACSCCNNSTDSRQRRVDECLNKSCSNLPRNMIHKHEDVARKLLDNVPRRPLTNDSRKLPHQEVTTPERGSYHSPSSNPRHGRTTLMEECSECHKLATHETIQAEVSPHQPETDITNDLSKTSLGARPDSSSTGFIRESEERCNCNSLLTLKTESQRSCNKNAVVVLSNESNKCPVCWDEQRQRTNCPDSLHNQNVESKTCDSTDRQSHRPQGISQRLIHAEIDNCLRASATNPESFQFLADNSRTSDIFRTPVKGFEYVQCCRSYGLAFEDVCDVVNPVTHLAPVRCEKCSLASFKDIFPGGIIFLLKNISDVIDKTNLEGIICAVCVPGAPVSLRRNINYEIFENLTQYVLGKIAAFIFSTSSHFLSEKSPPFLHSHLIWNISNQRNVYDQSSSTALPKLSVVSACPHCQFTFHDFRINHLNLDCFAVNSKVVETTTPSERIVTELSHTKNYVIDTGFTWESWPDSCAPTITESIGDYNFLPRVFHWQNVHSLIFNAGFAGFSCPCCWSSVEFLGLPVFGGSCTCSWQLFQPNVADHEKCPSGIELNRSRQKSMAEAKIPDVVYGACADKGWNEVVCCRNMELFKRSHDNSRINFEISKQWKQAQCSHQIKRQKSPGFQDKVSRNDELSETLKMDSSEFCDDKHSSGHIFCCDKMRYDDPALELSQRMSTSENIFQDNKRDNKTSVNESPHSSLEHGDWNTLCNYHLMCSDVTGDNFDSGTRMGDVNITNFELQSSVGNKSNTITLSQIMDNGAAINLSSTVSNTPFNSCKHDDVAQSPASTAIQHNSLDQPMLTSKSYVLRPNDRVRQFKLSSSNIVNHALHSLVPLAVGSNKSPAEKVENKPATSSIETQIESIYLNESSATANSYADLDSPGPSRETSRKRNASAGNNSISADVIDTTKGIHSILLGCVPTLKVEDAEIRSSLSDVAVPNSDTCEFFVQTVFDTFFSRNPYSFKSVPCLNAIDIDYANSELMDFPLSPLLCTNVEADQDNPQKQTDPSVFHIAGNSCKKLNTAFDFYESRVCKMRGPKRNGSAQSWFSLDDLHGQPASSRHASMVFLSSLRRQLNSVLSPKSIRQFFGVTEGQDAKNSGKRAPISRDTLTTNQINVIITRCDSLVLDKRHEMGLPPIRDRASTYDPSLDKPTRGTFESMHSFGGSMRPSVEGVSKPRACSLDTSYSSNSHSDDPSLLCRSQDLSFDRSRGASLDLLSPASASFRTGSMCSGISSLSKMTECSAYTEHSRSDCEKITRRTAEREHNITKLLGVITIMFVISWSVSWSVILIDILTLVPVTDMLTTNVTLSIARNLFLVNHFCNILVYAVLSKSFREKMAQCYKNCIHCCSY